MATRVIRTKFYVNHALVAADSAKLSDATGTYGVKRNDTNAVVVADGTDMTVESVGVYTHSFASVDDVAYTAWVEFVYDGNIYRKEIDFEATETPVETDDGLTVTYDVLRREVGLFLGYGHNISDWSGDSVTVSDVDQIVRTGVRRVLTPPPLNGEKYAHEWSFMRPIATLTTTPPYTTGTVAITDGVATITDGSWPSWATQGILTVGSGSYSVLNVDGTEATLSNTEASESAGATFELRRVAYDLPSNFAMIDGPLLYGTGQWRQGVIERMSEHQVLEAASREIGYGYPSIFAIRPKAIDMSATTLYEMLLSPAPDAEYTLHYHYRVAIPALGDTNVIPPGGDAHGELYVESCLAAAEQKFHERAGLHTARFTECLAAAVSHDRIAGCPDTVGFSMDKSDDMEAFDPEDHYWTCNGLTRYKGYPT
jgi:hypothetical protein